MLIVAGVGPGNPKYLTKDVQVRIEQASYILAFGRIADSLKSIRSDIISVTRVEEITNYLSNKKEILLLASGDPNFFGIVEFLKKKGLPIKEILPGISSFQYLMGKLQKSWQDAKFISLHGRDEELQGVQYHHLTIILIDQRNTPDKISRELYKIGIKGKIYIGFNLSYENETILIKNIGDEIETISSLGVVVVENEMD